MKVLHYVSNFSVPSETFIYDLINNLESVGINNHILTHRRQLKKERPFSKVCVINQKVSLYKKIYYRFCNKWQLKHEKILVDYIRKTKPDIIHAHFGPNGIKITKLMEKFDINIPIIVSFHGMDINVLPLKDPVYLRCLSQMSQNVNVSFTSPSEFLKRKIQSLGLNLTPLKIIPNAYNDNFTCIIKEVYWREGEEFKILSIGRFEEVKGLKYLINAFNNVLGLYQNSTLTIIGYGSLESDLRNLCESLKIQDKVTFMKKINHSELPNIIKEHDLYVQPSIIASDGAEENLSVSTIESQVCGLPAIVSNIGGLKEIVIDGVTGKFVEEKNSEQLSSAILFYIKNPKFIKVHSINARENAIKKFNKNKITNMTREYYENIQKK